MFAKIIYSLACTLLILVVGAGCAGNSGIQLLSGSGTNSPQDAVGGTPPAPGGPGGSIDSSGTTIPDQPLGNDPNSVEPSQPGGPGGSDAQPVNMLTYTDQQFGFSIQYPNIYTILDEIQLLTDVSPNLVHRVRFQEGGLVNAPSVSPEIPAFSIEIYSNPSITPLDGWITNDIPSGTKSAVTVDGVPCTQVSLMTLQAPNLWVFCSRNTYVYKFTLAGQYAQQMLDTFKFGK